MHLMARSLLTSLCPLCTFEAPNVTIFLRHLRTVHSSDPHFIVTCGLDGCTTTSKSFSSLYSHIYRRHPDFIKKRKDPLYTTPQTLSNEATGISQARNVQVNESVDLTGNINEAINIMPHSPPTGYGWGKAWGFDLVKFQTPHPSGETDIQTSTSQCTCTIDNQISHA